MDAILDLASRAVSIVVLIQDSLLVDFESRSVFSKDFPEELRRYIGKRQQDGNYRFFENKGVEITYISSDIPVLSKVNVGYFYDRCEDLVYWLHSQAELIVCLDALVEEHPCPVPEQWRETIRDILYMKPEERIKLSNALHYMPLQVILATGASSLNAKEQRLLQIWNVNNELSLNAILSEGDIKVYKDLTNPSGRFSVDDATKIAKRGILLEDENELIKGLENEKIPFSFHYILRKELEEIEKARKIRHSETGIDQQILPHQKPFFKRSFKDIFGNRLKSEITDKIYSANPAIPENPVPNSLLPRPTALTSDYATNCDPIKCAKDMDLWALAFSGGGIRSATFNLGILQGLAKKGLLSRFDYLSTVSGGGYLGGWFVSWIYRCKSLRKVSDRLDPEKSSDPLADEVRPIRWLRMYSNFLAPSTGAMSTDSWTVGMTLLRNMLINQVVILFFLLALISAVKLIFSVWENPPVLVFDFFNSQSFTTWSWIFLLATSIIAGLGMRNFFAAGNNNSGQVAGIDTAISGMINGSVKKGGRYMRKLKLRITTLITVMACLTSLIMASWIYQNARPFNGLYQDFQRMPIDSEFIENTLWAGFISLLIVYILGKYYKEIATGKNRFIEILFDAIGSFIAAASGVILLYLLVDGAYQYFDSLPTGENDRLSARFSFTLLPPLIIEIFTITIVIRMALLGKNFPDNRREWWGRIGGRVHRVSLVWLVVIGFMFLSDWMVDFLNDNIIDYKEFFVAGWGATILTGLRAAFTTETSGVEKPKGVASQSMEILALIAPYLFGIFLLAFVPILFDLIHTYFADRANLNDPLLELSLFTLALSLISIFLGWRIGVNQFSMHLFYKNRLVRGFLAATRFRYERQKTANPFTGFDEMDDLKLKEIESSNGYFGPYPILNTTLNATQDTSLDRQDRKAESFIFSPLFCGFDFSRTRSAANIQKKSYDYAYRPTKDFAYPDGPQLGTAMTISGAAANPNQGYHSNTATSFLLTLFNVRLGWWIGNPRQNKWRQSDPKSGLGYIVSDLVGKSDTTKDFVCLSDGGHFDNMGIYELIRRRCKNIVLCDGEQDGKFTCEGLANAIRRCRIDFGVEIIIDDIDSITKLNERKESKSHYVTGCIYYPEDKSNPGNLLYIKSSVTGREPVDVREYGMKNKDFPHQSTGDQFFDEAQFESYRKLGLHIVEELLP